MRRRLGSFGARLALVLGLALLVRWGYTLTVARDTGGLGDFLFFHWTGRLLAEGRGFIDPFLLRLEGRAVPTAGHPPLWPAVLAAVSELGGTDRLAHKLTGGLIGTAVVGLIGLLGRRAGGDRVGLLAAALAAIYPVLVAADGSLMSETLYGLWVVLALLAAWRLLDRPTAARAAVLGALIGLAGLTRGEGLLLGPLLAVPVAWAAGGPPRARAGRVAVAALAAVAVLAPWTARNLASFDRPVLLSTNDSTVLAGANCDRTYSGRELGGWEIECISRRRAADESVQADIWRREGLAYASDHLAHLPVVMAVRVLRTWDLWQPRRSVLRAEGQPVRAAQAATAAFFLYAALAVLGIVVLRRRGVPLIVLIAPLLLVTVSSALGWGLPRFRHAAEPSIVVLAAVGVAFLADRRARRRARVGAVAAGA